MDEKNRHPGIPDGTGSIGFVDIEPSVNLGPDFYKRPGQPGWDLHLIRDLSDDCFGRGIGAVGDDAFDIFRKIQFRGHQHRCSAHGDAEKNDLGIRAETLQSVSHPAENVPALLDSEGDGPALTFSMGPLIHQQQVVPKAKAQL